MTRPAHHKEDVRMADLDSVTSEEWRRAERNANDLVTMWAFHESANAHAYAATYQHAAEYAARMAEAAEWREACQRGEHVPVISESEIARMYKTPGCVLNVHSCLRCGHLFKSPPVQPSAEDVQAALALFDGDVAWPSHWSDDRVKTMNHKADGVIRAMIRDFAERKGIK